MKDKTEAITTERDLLLLALGKFSKDEKVD